MGKVNANRGIVWLRGYCLKLLCCLFVLVVFSSVYGQTAAPELEAEAVAERGREQGWDEEGYEQAWERLRKHPINLNTIDEDGLVETGIFTPLQISQFLRYRWVFGKLISIYELQAVPGWDMLLLQRLRPFVTVEGAARLWPAVWQRLRKGDHQLLLRLSQVLENTKAYREDSTGARYTGSPQHILLRYRYMAQDGLEYGVTGEKDAGESFFGRSQRRGFDFYSAHFFLRRAGRLKALALGDFTVQMGQGLIQWQGFALSKGGNVLQIKRESPVLRPYHGSGEFYFHRGAGVTVGTGRWELTGFASFRKLDASMADSGAGASRRITGLQNSGYHRTARELENRAVQEQQVYGFNLNGHAGGTRMGCNFLLYGFRYPFALPAQLYRRYQFSGDRLMNYSGYYSYTRRNFHFFGEAAADGEGHTAFVQGVLFSAATTVDMAVLYRKTDRAYHTLYSNAFTESDAVANESGVYAGISIRPTAAWRIDGYADLYRHPWLRYRADGPSAGRDYLVQATWKPNKHIEAYSRFRSGLLTVNLTDGMEVLPPVELIPLRSWRLQVQYRLNPALVLRQRMEMNWYRRGMANREEGFLWFTDLVFKPMLRPYGGNLRVMYFETDSYNTRLYAYENDVLYGSLIPFFHEKGWRFYINANLDIGKKLSVWLRIARTEKVDKGLINNELNGSDILSQTEVKLQLRFTIQQF